MASVFIGDTITCTVTITEKNEAQRLVLASASFTHQDGLEVLRAQFGVFPADVHLAK